MSIMTMLLWIVVLFAAGGIVVSRKWPFWTVVLVAPALVIAAEVAWWAVKTAIDIAIVVAVIGALCYCAWWALIKPATAKK